LVDEGIASDEELNELQSGIHDAVEEALEFARESPYPEPDELFEDMYADPITV
jgi:pyruvate dehydrogenase E1 component alpha subunit